MDSKTKLRSSNSQRGGKSPSLMPYLLICLLLLVFIVGVYAVTFVVFDICSTNPVDGEVLVFNSATGEWCSSNTTGSLLIEGSLQVGTDPPPEVPLTEGEIYSTFSIRTGGSLASEALDWGPALWVAPSDSHIMHQSVGDFDYTGGAYENLFTSDTAVFDQADEDNTNFLVIVAGVRLGAASEIREFISATQVVLSTAGWDEDLVNQVFIVVTHPTLFVGDGNIITSDASDGGYFEIHGDDQTSPFTFKIEHEAAAVATKAFVLEIEAQGYAETDGLHIDYTTGNATANSNNVLTIAVDESDANGADIDIMHIGASEAGNSTVTGLRIGVGLDTALIVEGGGSPKKDPDYGYEVTSGVTVDRVNSGGAGDDAFINAVVNVDIFSSQNDAVLIGDDDTFEVIAYIEEVSAGKDMLEVYEYSTGVDTWALLIPENSVEGFQQSGSISFIAPVDWAKTNQADGDAVTNAYYVRITRLRGGNVVTLPVERTFSIYESGASAGLQIRGDGTIVPAQMIDGNAPNDSLYFSTTQSKLVYKDSTGNVHDLW